MTDKTQQKKFKSKWFRVAVAGDTSDGREISSEWIIQMAQTYNMNTYGARINVEHIRSYFPDSSFGAYGDVIALKTEKVDINGEQKDALFAQIQPNDNLIALNQKNQKIYTSIEVDPNFAKTGQAYLVGLAVTDSPASLGTEMLQFAAGAATNPFNARKLRPEDVITAAQETAFEFEEVKESFSSDLVNKVKNLFKKQEQQQQQTQDNFSQSEQAILEIAQQTANQGTEFSELKQKHEQLQQDFNQLKTKLDQEPQGSPRPGSNNSQFKHEEEQVDC
ncbi:GPO family capsid scaffolding protein [Acinetobacter baumannii]|uniref:GPO family capsid scaffolding protein n=1 Tax=Acinetobacter TaxID=469 RepID=UPI000707BC43|nr:MULTISPECIES: GPO family capsid scaffolding protein [Acinetobacter]KQD33590.1 capsid protein [Acinetobacter baumannii]MDA3502767.1 GPO family capsid scaffolding protein [Acinetobacter sp. AOR34_HL]MDR7655051.1 GPO family capsid scaffolding protein [Acinetobacter junii]MDS9865961.1 capsid protein [Acinetobacter pittii]PZT89801.1 MAG: capsid protein [Acinetobacter sp.]